ncbi:HXXEE domain-containing protein [Ornithobacterium rhinotracheale]|uniref:HXXEE domain-containing protein n=1 Tax=Ornithobacterium rhinotracheale TaxID=28251 RepID=UPI003FA4A1B8
MKVETLVILFLVIFILHEFEEIIFFKSWLNKNMEEITERFPQFARKVLPHWQSLSTSSFTLAVAEEFLILSVVSIYAVIFQEYQLWLALFVGFSVHLIFHIIQWILYKKYIPCIASTLLVFPICIYIFVRFNQMEIMDLKEQCLWGIFGVIFSIANLVAVHLLLNKIDLKL